jgi:predicted fused transcriptional regulator/phosphomethylpyrimidine kinase
MSYECECTVLVNLLTLSVAAPSFKSKVIRMPLRVTAQSTALVALAAVMLGVGAVTRRLADVIVSAFRNKRSSRSGSNAAFSREKAASFLTCSFSSCLRGGTPQTA